MDTFDFEMNWSPGWGEIKTFRRVLRDELYAALWAWIWERPNTANVVSDFAYEDAGFFFQVHQTDGTVFDVQMVAATSGFLLCADQSEMFFPWIPVGDALTVRCLLTTDGCAVCGMQNIFYFLRFLRFLRFFGFFGF